MVDEVGEFRAQVPWLFQVNPDKYKPLRCEHALTDAERAIRDRAIVAMNTLAAGARQGFYRDRALYILMIATALHDLHDAILDAGAHYGVRFLSLGPSDLVVFGGHEWNGNPVAWRIAALIGFYTGVGNGPQAQIYDVFVDYTDCFGIWDCVTGERLADAFTLDDVHDALVDNPIPPLNIPDFEAMRLR